MKELLHVPSGEIIKFYAEDNEGGSWSNDTPTWSIEQFCEHRRTNNLQYCNGLKFHTSQEVLDNIEYLSSSLLPEQYQDDMYLKPEYFEVIEDTPNDV